MIAKWMIMTTIMMIMIDKEDEKDNNNTQHVQVNYISAATVWTSIELAY